MRLLKTIKVRNIKCSKTIVKHRSDGPSGGPREGHVGVKLGSSWPLKGILRHLNIILPTKVNLRGGKSHFRSFTRAPEAPRGGDIGEGLD